MSDAQSEQEEVIKSYRIYIQEVHYRMDAIESIFESYAAGLANNMHHVIDVEVCYLQLRKICELIMFASVAIQAQQASTLKRLDREYSAGRIFSAIKKLNPSFFPVPIEVVKVSGESAFVKIRPQSDKFPHLTECEFIDFYNRKAGIFAHANKDFGLSHDEVRKELDFLMGIYGKFVYLLVHHKANLPNRDWLIASCFNNTDAGPLVSYWSYKSEIPLAP